MYKNIVFDLGGVVFNYSPRDYLADRFFHTATENKIYNAVFGSDEWQKMDRGELSYNEAAAIFLERGREEDVAFEVQAVVDNWTEMLTTRKATINLIRLFKKKGFNVYYLSNISREILAYIKKKDYYALFDGGVASCEVGLLKPDPEIYHQLTIQYGLLPQETIFTDDRMENAAGAFQAGITGIQFRDVKSFCQALVTYGIEV